MIHMLFWNQKGAVQLQSFASRASYNDWYNGYAPGQLIEKADDLAALKARYSGHTEVSTLLDSIDPAALVG